MWHAKFPRYIAWSDALLGELHNPLPDQIGQGTPVHKHSAELIDSAMTFFINQINEYFNKQKLEKSHSKVFQNLPSLV